MMENKEESKILIMVKSIVPTNDARRECCQKTASCVSKLHAFKYDIQQVHSGLIEITSVSGKIK